MLLDIVTPSRRLRSLKDDRVRLPVETDDVIIPGLEGEFEVLPGHSPFITLLGTGILKFTVKGGGDISMMVSGGFAEIDRDRVTVMCEAAALTEEVEMDSVKASLAEAEQGLKALGAVASTDEEFGRLKAEAERAAAKMTLLK
jgi:F-type H+-transporting ATPase subunit epsilon